ncbi:C-X-C chemokine receptor type 5 isoform X2 [Dendropsophus ebraccatus]
MYDEDYTCYKNLNEGENEDSQVYRVLIPILYTLVFVVGAVGNSLVLFILMRNHNSRSSTDSFLFHLAIADLLMLFTFPFTIIEVMIGWQFGDFLCKVLAAISSLNFYCSSLLLGCISIDRYLSIIYAIHTFRKRSIHSVHLACFIIWIFCFLLSVPKFFSLGANKTDNGTWCTYHQINFSDNFWWQGERFVNHIVGFLIPLVIMTICYSHIIATLYMSPRREKKKAVRVAIVITGVFFLCWTPYNVAVFIDTLNQYKLIHSCAVEVNLPIVITVTEVLGLTHCCLNPLLYAFVGAKFRNDALKVLKLMGCSKSKLFLPVATLSRKSSTTESESRTVISSI